MTRRCIITGAVRVCGVAAAVAACGGVAPDAVAREANMIDKNAQTAQVLHARCVDAGQDADPGPFCAAEMQTLTDIRGNAATLLQAAGAKDGGGP